MDKETAQETGATPRWVNLAPKPCPSELPGILRNLDDPDYFEVLRNLDEDAVVGIALSTMTKVHTPADLEYLYKGLMLSLISVAAEPRHMERCTKIYHEMWHYFLGGLS